MRQAVRACTYTRLVAFCSSGPCGMCKEHAHYTFPLHFTTTPHPQHCQPLRTFKLISFLSLRQAFLEWVPVRGLPPEQAAHFQKAHRSFKFGDLATLVRAR